MSCFVIVHENGRKHKDYWEFPHAVDHVIISANWILSHIPPIRWYVYWIQLNLNLRINSKLYNLNLTLEWPSTSVPPCETVVPMVNKKSRIEEETKYNMNNQVNINMMNGDLPRGILTLCFDCVSSGNFPSSNYIFFLLRFFFGTVCHIRMFQYYTLFTRSQLLSKEQK